MTALKDYVRLETSALWHESPEAQRREVQVSLGDASLILRHVRSDEPLAHWSLPALRRLNPGKLPAIYAPGPDAVERLEIADDTFVEALDRLLAVLERRRPRPGRVRWLLAGAITAGVLAVLFLWLPGALVRHVVAVAPDSTRAAIGRALLDEITALAGRPCDTPAARQALQVMAGRLFPAAGRAPGRIVVLKGGGFVRALLPGGILLLNRTTVELAETPEVPAGHALAALVATPDPFARLMSRAGGLAAFRLLTTGRIDRATLKDQARRILTETPPLPATAALLAAFRKADIPAAPLAYDLDVTGESTLSLIEGDPLRGRPYRPVLSDGQWIALQEICEA